MVRYRKPRFPVPASLYSDIDAQAAKVISLRKDAGDLAYKVRWYDHEAYRAAFTADTAANAAVRKAEYDRAGRLRQKGAGVRVKLGRLERTLGEAETALTGLHRTARQYQRGELEEDDGDE